MLLPVKLSPSASKLDSAEAELVTDAEQSERKVLEHVEWVWFGQLTNVVNPT